MKEWNIRNETPNSRHRRHGVQPRIIFKSYWKPTTSKSIPAVTVASAWERLKVQKYDLVITDLRMPELGGHELLARVRGEKMPVGRDRSDRLRRPGRSASRHEGRRGRFRLEAVRSRPAAHAGEAHSRAPRADGRARAASQTDARRLSVSQHGFQEPEDPQDFRPDRASRAARFDGADPRRDRHRQGARRSGARTPPTRGEPARSVRSTVRS